MKSYDQYIREFDFYIKDSKLDSNDKKKIQRLKDIFISKFKYLSTIDNKYLNDVTKRLEEDIKSRIFACKRRKAMIQDQMNLHTINFGSIEMESLDNKIDNFEEVYSNLNNYYLQVLCEELDYIPSDSNKLYDECLSNINSQSNSPILFFGKQLSDSIVQIFELISNEKLIEKYKSIILLKNEINELISEIDRISFMRKHSGTIKCYFNLEESMMRDTTIIRKQSDRCDELEELIKLEENNWLFRMINLSKKDRSKLHLINDSIQKRFNNQMKKVSCMKKIKSFFNKNGYDIAKLENYLYFGDETYSNKLDFLCNELNSKKQLLQELISTLSNEEKDLLDNNYLTIENIVKYIVNNKSNTVDMYILYMLVYMDELINEKISITNSNEYIVNDIIAKYRSICTDQINNVANGRNVTKIKAR